MLCRIEYRINGTPGHAEVEAEDSIAGLLQWLEGIPQSAGVRAVVKVLKPAEVVQ